MLHATYESQNCSIARALEAVGERWTLLVVRDLFLGLRRFDELQADLGIARNVLTTRLEKLTALGIVERVPYSERPPRHEYRLTLAGRGLWPTIHTLMLWGDAHAPHPDGPPTLVRHRDCGGRADDHLHCDRCGARLQLGDVSAEPGPGAQPDHVLHRRAPGGPAPLG